MLKMTDIIDKAEEFKIETDINKRWENGTPHHPKSEDLMEALMDIDFNLCDDHFCWKKGGDGDNGEALMYQLDIYFETMDTEKLRMNGEE